MALVVNPQRQDPKWSPTILGAFSNSHGEIRITLHWTKINQSNSVEETLPICWVRLTLPEQTPATGGKGRKAPTRVVQHELVFG